jgi:hypothetical protein
MSNVIARPEILSAAAGELHSINAAMQAGSAAAAVPTTGLVPAAADLVSLLTAAQFASHARLYQAVSAQAAAAQEQLASMLGISAGSYSATEAANVSLVG